MSEVQIEINCFYVVKRRDQITKLGDREIYGLRNRQGVQMLSQEYQYTITIT